MAGGAGRGGGKFVFHQQLGVGGSGVADSAGRSFGRRILWGVGNEEEIVRHRLARPGLALWKEQIVFRRSGRLVARRERNEQIVIRRSGRRARRRGRCEQVVGVVRRGGRRRRASRSGWLAGACPQRQGTVIASEARPSPKSNRQRSIWGGGCVFSHSVVNSKKKFFFHTQKCLPLRHPEHRKAEVVP